MIIVDSNIFIFNESADSPERQQSLRKYEEAMLAGQLGINEVIVSEVFHRLQRLFGGAEAYSRMASIFSSPAITFMNFNQDTVMRAIRLARDFNLRINDALIAQQAIEMGASVLTDDIKDFGKVKAVKVIPLR
jgi:predicted nucleic acid-binding protein